MDVLEHRISDILQNHEQEQRAIERQITAERAKLLEDVERIRERVYPGGISYDNITVKTSTEPDMKLVNIADAIQRRTEKTEQVIAKLEKRLELIQRVYDTVLQMDARDKIILLTLYYPRRTYEQAAETLGIDVSTVSRRRKTAVKKLAQRFRRIYGKKYSSY